MNQRQNLKTLALEEVASRSRVEEANRLVEARESARNELLGEIRQRILAGEEFDPKDYDLWAAVNFQIPVDEHRAKAQSIAGLLGSHTGELVARYYSHVTHPTVLRVGTISENGLQVVRTRVPEGADFETPSRELRKVIAHPLWLNIATQGDVVKLAYVTGAFASPDDPIIPGTAKSGNGRYIREVRFHPSNLEVIHEIFPGLKEEDKLFSGSYRPKKGYVASSSRAAAKGRTPERTINIAVGDDAVRELLSSTINVDFHKGTCPRDIYHLLGEKDYP